MHGPCIYIWWLYVYSIHRLLLLGHNTTYYNHNVQRASMLPKNCYRSEHATAFYFIYIYMHYANLTLSNVKYKYLYLIELRKLVVIHSNGMRQDLKVVGTLSVKFFRDRTWSSFVPIVSNYYYYYYYCDLTRVIHEKESRGRRSLIIIGSLKNLIFASLSSVYSINFAWSKLSLVGRL